MIEDEEEKVLMDGDPTMEGNELVRENWRR